jgi:hypothetical protein
VVRQANSSDLCALPEVKEYLFRGGGNNVTQADDNLLQRLITAASEWIRNETSRKFAPGNYTEVRCGDGGRILFFRNTPVSAVVSLYIDGNAQNARNSNVTAYGENGYTFSENRIVMTGNVFTRGIDNVQVTYTVANNAAFPDLEQVAVEAVTWAYRELDRLGQTSKTLAGETISFSTQAMSDRSKKTLARYKSPIPKI